MSPFEYIQQKVFTKLKPSSYNGIGVFALRDIPKDTFLFETWQGTSGTFEITEEELNTLPIQLKEHIKDIFLFHPDFPNNTNTPVELRKNCHWIYTTPYYFVNSGFTDSYNLDKSSLRTIRGIREGEEILMDIMQMEANKVC
mgnify:FL=1